MAGRRTLREKRGWAFTTAVAILKPVLTLATRRDWHGGEHIPQEGGCVLAVNHVSHLDPLTFAHFVYDHGRLPRYLAKAEVFDIPFAGRIVRGSGQIPVARLTSTAGDAFAAAVDAVRDGKLVVVYPEGTITRDPGLWPMVGKTGAARIALATGCPVVPVAQWGIQEILAPYAKKVDLLPRKTVTVRAGSPVDLRAYDGAQPTPEVLRAVTEEIMTAITDQLEQVRGERAPAERFDPRRAGVRQIGNPHGPDGSDKKTRRRRR